MAISERFAARIRVIGRNPVGTAVSPAIISLPQNGPARPDEAAVRVACRHAWVGPLPAPADRILPLSRRMASGTALPGGCPQEHFRPRRRDHVLRLGRGA